MNISCTVLGEPEVDVGFTWSYPGQVRMIERVRDRKRETYSCKGISGVQWMERWNFFSALEPSADSSLELNFFSALHWSILNFNDNNNLPVFLFFLGPSSS